jgi:hypothetical protein
VASRGGFLANSSRICHGIFSKPTEGGKAFGSFGSNVFAATGHTPNEDISNPDLQQKLMEHGAILHFDQEFRQKPAPPGSS